MSAAVTTLPRRGGRSLVVGPPLSQQVALVTGANRGLGLEVVRQLCTTGMTVLLGTRELAAGEKVAKQLRRDGADVVAVKLDVTSQPDIDALAACIDKNYGRLDVLVNNAGSHYDVADRPSSVAMDTVRAAMETNLFGAWRLSEAVLPLMRRHGYGRVVNVSSGCGSSAAQREACPAYRVSKSALNTYTRALASEMAGSGILVNAVCPGWVATDMGGPGGRPVNEGAAGIVWAACLPEHATTNGGFFRDRERIAW